MDSINVKLKCKEYTIFIKRGLIDCLGQEIRRIYNGDKIAVITDENVNRIYGDKVISKLSGAGFNAVKIVVPAGEKSKSFEVLTGVYTSLASAGITRGDMIAALGGGVVGDLAGFAAATFLRGIPFVQIPTTFLAQIDSSIGGKTAVDIKEGKNLVGCFYNPEGVFIDPELLETLEKRFLHDGTAEAVKYGCIKDKKLFDRLCNYKNSNELLDDMEYIIHTCCSIKRDIVQNDERDKGERMVLNFGHTIGHAIEKYFNYEKYTHGEAVAAGMYIMTVNSQRLGLTKHGTAELIGQVLNKYNLPLKADIGDPGGIMDIIRLDKKNMGSSLNIIILEEIGKAKILNKDSKYIRDNFKFI